MKIIYYKDPIGNFGDDLNEWIWNDIAPFLHGQKSEYSLLGIGSILDINMIKNEKVIVFSSGIGYGPPPTSENIKIQCVRGKLTAKVLGIDESLAIADGAILLNLHPKFTPIPKDERHGIIFIPHHNTMEHQALYEVCNNAGIELVNPCQNAKDVINKIRNAKLVIAEAMHAAIIADAMRVNWVPVVLNHDINTFKWLDWLSTFDMPYNPIYIGLPSLKSFKRSKFLIKHNMGMFKPNYHKMNEIELLSSSKKTSHFHLTKILLKIQQLFITKKDNNKHKKTISNLLIQASQSQGYLSGDDVFNKNLNLLKNKLNELNH
ncbi:polysaccharide pyruvyl transferase family protein [Orbus wheelerorum]|uniref:polysaccharide pyruvyl transferase family protein n=1 Tax=Orbus wheelerorum TaxID=3074111 RepID=UPI00370DB322